MDNPSKCPIIPIYISMPDYFIQTEGYIAIIPPFQSRQEIARYESSLHLIHQRFAVFIYSNAVAVFAVSDFFINLILIIKNSLKNKEWK